jgi:glutaminase
MNVEQAVRVAYEAGLAKVGVGAVAQYLTPEFGAAPDRLGIAVAGLDGRVYGAGDWQTPFCIQSISKVFSLALALRADGERSTLWTRVGRSPSRRRYDSGLELEDDRGVPCNPYVNAGALVVTDHLVDLLGSGLRDALLGFLRRQSRNADVASSGRVVALERRHQHRNAALAHLLASYGNLGHAVGQVLDDYAWQCAIEMSCRDLARAGLVLADEGRAVEECDTLPARDVRRINATLLTCGTYDGAGDFAYTVGIPAKSAVSGAILAVVPRRWAICTWSPRLDGSGTSVAGMEALQTFVELLGISLF